MLFVRTLLYTTVLFAWVIPHALWVLVARPFDYDAALKSAYWWGRLQMWGLRVLCGIDYRVEGLEHVPRDRPVVCFIKHTSAWETAAQIVVFPGQSWVLKRELMWIPILGWALWELDAIHIDRGAGSSAVLADSKVLSAASGARRWRS